MSQPQENTTSSPIFYSSSTGDEVQSKRRKRSNSANAKRREQRPKNSPKLGKRDSPAGYKPSPHASPLSFKRRASNGHVNPAFQTPAKQSAATTGGKNNKFAGKSAEAMRLFLLSKKMKRTEAMQAEALKANAEVGKSNDSLFKANDAVAKANEALARANEALAKANDSAANANDSLAASNRVVAEASLQSVAIFAKKLEELSEDDLSDYLALESGEEAEDEASVVAEEMGGDEESIEEVTDIDDDEESEDDDDHKSVVESGARATTSAKNEEMGFSTSQLVWKGNIVNLLYYRLKGDKVTSSSSPKECYDYMDQLSRRARLETASSLYGTKMTKKGDEKLARIYVRALAHKNKYWDSSELEEAKYRLSEGLYLRKFDLVLLIEAKGDSPKSGSREKLFQHFRSIELEDWDLVALSDEDRENVHKIDHFDGILDGIFPWMQSQMEE